MPRGASARRAWRCSATPSSSARDAARGGDAGGARAGARGPRARPAVPRVQPGRLRQQQGPGGCAVPRPPAGAAARRAGAGRVPQRLHPGEPGLHPPRHLRRRSPGGLPPTPLLPGRWPLRAGPPAHHAAAIHRVVPRVGPRRAGRRVRPDGRRDPAAQGLRAVAGRASCWSSSRGSTASTRTHSTRSTPTCAFARRNGVDLLDLLDVFLHHGDEALRVSAANEHPNARAHRMAARAIAEFVLPRAETPR